MRFLFIFYQIVFLQLISIHAFGQNAQQLKFVQNKGQWDASIDFLARVPGGHLGLSAGTFSVQLYDMEKLEELHLKSHGHISEATGKPDDEPLDGHYFKMNLVGANADAEFVLEEALQEKYNYFLGTDRARWATNVRAFASIRYKEVYRGIDLRVSSADHHLKYDFIVKPGADPSQILIEYCGTNGVKKRDEELKIHTSVGTLTERIPYSYQILKQQEQSVKSEYRLDNNCVSFSFPEGYDASAELVIDPLLIFSTYSGSTADNWGSTATPGEHGTLYSAGVTNQISGGTFPATAGAFQTEYMGNFDMGIIKYDSLGTQILYATYLGGMNNDSPTSLVVDKATNDLIVLGLSGSTDFPTSIEGFDTTFNGGTTVFNRVLNTEDEWDIVLTRLTAEGDQLVGSTYLGGSGNDGLNTPKQSGGPLVANYGDEMRGDVITDEVGNVYVSTVTASADFPIVNGYDSTFNGITDAVVVKLVPDLSDIHWSSFVGGTSFDASHSILFDSDYNVLVAGGTSSSDFPVTDGAYQTTFGGIVDGWIARISSDGSALMDATLTGTLSFDQVYFVDLDAFGDIYCYGQTAGRMPVTPGVYSNPNSGQFLQKFTSDLTTLEFSTVFGSGLTGGLVLPNISPTAFLVNECNNIYMAGWGGFVNSSVQTGFWRSTTDGMPTTEDAHQRNTSGSDFYFMVLNGDASQLVYATYLGGNSSKTHVDGGTSRFDKFGIVYHAVCAGCSFGNETGGPTSDFPTTPNAHSRINGSGNCNNAAFKFDLSSIRAMFETNNTALTMPGFNNVCSPDTIVFQNTSIGGVDIFWDFGDGTTLEQSDDDPRSVLHQYQEEGQYAVKLKITDLSTCTQTDSVIKIINYYVDNISVGEDAQVCEGADHQLTASGGETYEWTSSDGSFNSAEQSPIVQPESDTTSYFVTVTDEHGCTKQDTIVLTLIRVVQASFQTFDPGLSIPDYNDVCYPDSMLFQNLSANATGLIWNFGDGTIITTRGDTTALIHRYEESGVYEVILTALNPSTCNKSATYTKTIRYFREQIIVGSDGEICEGTEFQLSASGAESYFWRSADNTFTSSSPNPIVEPDTTTQYYVTANDANDCVREDTVTVRVVEEVPLQWQYEFIATCNNRPILQVENLSEPEDDVVYTFDFGDGTAVSDPSATHEYAADGTYLVTLSAQREFCTFEESVPLPIYKLFIPNVITPKESPGLNDTFQVVFGPEQLAPADVGLSVDLLVVNRLGKTVFEAPDYQNDWDGADLASGVYYVHVKIGGLTDCKNWLQILK